MKENLVDGDTVKWCEETLYLVRSELVYRQLQLEDLYPTVFTHLLSFSLLKPTMLSLGRISRRQQQQQLPCSQPALFRNQSQAV